jgi:BirA family biotin operon repressor/biotin-[acetyl-CoA-carboxylase] ligase
MHWPAEAIWETVAPQLPGFTVEIVPEIGSTNTELMHRARLGRVEPVLLVAERQTAGRGRLGRGWDSGGALTFSLGLPLAPQDWSGLSLAVGVAVADALDPQGRRIGLKWPNDLWVEGRKLAGILVETAGFGGPPGGSSGLTPPAGLAGRLPRYAVVGIGLNLAPRPAEGLSTPPAALHEWWPGITAGQALGRIAAPLVALLQAFERDGFAPLRPRFAARDVLQDRPLRLSDGRTGRGGGVDPAGALQLQTDAGMVLITSAGVSVRPAD